MCFFNRYCDCFANGEFCNNCNCNNCFNNLEHETERQKAIKVRLHRCCSRFLLKGQTKCENLLCRRPA